MVADAKIEGGRSTWRKQMSSIKPYMSDLQKHKTMLLAFFLSYFL